MSFGVFGQISKADEKCPFPDLDGNSETIEIFESTLGALDPTMRSVIAKAKPAKFPLKERNDLFRAHDINDPKVKQVLTQKIDAIYGAMKEVKPEGRALDRETALRLTRFMGEKLIEPESREVIVVDRQAKDNEEAAFQYGEGGLSFRERLLNQTIREIHTHLAATGFPKTPDASLKIFINQLVQDLFQAAKQNKEYTQPYWLRSRLIGNQNLTEPQRDKLFGWIVEAIQEELKTNYQGFEGQMKHAEEYRKGNIYSSWIHMRGYSDYDFLRSLGWRTLDYYINVAGYQELKEDLRVRYRKFWDKYAGPDGYKKVGSDYFSDKVQGIRKLIKELIYEEQYDALGWTSKGHYLANLLTPEGKIVKKYQTRAGLIAFKKETALNSLTEEDPNFPSDPRYQTKEQQDRIKEIESEIQIAIKEQLSKPILAEARWDYDEIEIPLTRKQLLAQYKGPLGMLRYSQDSNLHPRKLIALVNEKHGKGTSEALGWKTNFIEVDASLALLEQVLATPSRPHQRYVSIGGLQRLSIDRDEYTYTTRTSVRSLLTPEQSRKLQWPTDKYVEPVQKEWELAVDAKRKGIKSRADVIKAIAARVRSFPSLQKKRLERTFREVQFVEERILTASGEINPLYQGETGMKRYASLFHDSLQRNAYFVVEQVMGPDTIKRLQWPRVESGKKIIESLREEARQRRWVILRSESGKMDPYLTGPLGLLRYAQLKGNLNLAQARNHAKNLLAEAEYRTLKWEMKTQLTETPSQDSGFSPWEGWSKAQQEAATQYLGFMMTHGQEPTARDWGRGKTAIEFSPDQLFGEGSYAPGKTKSPEAIFPDRETARREISLYGRTLGFELAK